MKINRTGFLQGGLTAIAMLFSQWAVADTVSVANTLERPADVPCPVEFFSLRIPQAAKQCQLFDTQTESRTLPASMVFFMAQGHTDVVRQLQQTMPALAVHSTFNQRTLLVSSNNAIRVVVSPDGDGAQIDILVAAES
ncbi:hypothetical protein OCL06_12755 [Alteromonas sp. ASW11-19]|uniref:DUF3019 domain-containing protein n=1 Tax=Alteromonas salexigens TaxID=2982530 RepID=A0ABT2VRD1_9ALTE|nr:hypothetical protein [Alteromonas salexigens]MCU7555458.1 hypothetical protein [Alteromonas salexigens]